MSSNKGMAHITPPPVIDQFINDIRTGKISLETPDTFAPFPDAHLVCTSVDAVRILQAHPYPEPDYGSEGIVLSCQIVGDFDIPENITLPFYALTINSPIDGDVTIAGQIGDRRRLNDNLDSYGVYFAEPIAGNATISGQIYGDLTIDGVGGDLIISGQIYDGQTSAKPIQGDVHVTPTGILDGVISLANVEGDVRMEGHVVSVGLGQGVMGNCIITAQSQRLKVNGVVGDFRLEQGASTEKLTIECLKGDLVIAGIVGPTGLTGPRAPVIIRETLGNVHITATAEIHGPLELENWSSVKHRIHGDLIIDQRSSIIGDCIIGDQAVGGHTQIGGMPSFH